MRCHDCQKQLLAYLDGEVTSAQKMELETHLLTCARCAEALALLEEETVMLKKVLNAPALAEDFADQLVKQLTPYQPAAQSPLAQAEAGMPPAAHSFPQTGRRLPKSRQRMRTIALSLVLGLCFSMALGMYLSPTFAAYISSFISRIGGEEGLKKAAEQGYSTPINKAVTSNGVTFRIKDIIADTNRLVVSYTLEDSHGKILPNLFIPYWEDNKVNIMDKNGNIIDEGVSFQQGAGYADFMFTLQNPPDDVIVHFDIRKYGSKEGSPVNWKMDIPVNLTKSLAASKTEQMEKSYKSPAGYDFVLNKVTYSPSAVRLDITSERTKKEMERIRSMASTLQMKEQDIGLLGEMQFSFRIVDQKGRTVADSQRGPIDQNRLIYFNPVKSTEEGKGLYLAAYVPGPESEKLTFILDSVKVRDRANFFMELDPKQLEKGPITKEYPELGRSYTLKGMKKGTDPETNEPAWEIELEGITPEDDDDFPHYWNLYDAKGNHYEVKSDYSRSELGGKIGEKHHLKQVLIIKDLTEVNGPLKLDLQTYWKEIDNLGWEVPIPQAKE
ncbi:DUF4179 domain-containing protein [Brevibacillus migulae]|uniref:DUF4179 domain-containing protein n=1 Tax=Brevibacillus migulae TaxID=1644114 RepID=UPI00143206F4|nr:DUF4179 domain-containing protein [Brevibacillus migulae]